MKEWLPEVKRTVKESLAESDKKHIEDELVKVKVLLEGTIEKFKKTVANQNKYNEDISKQNLDLQVQVHNLQKAVACLEGEEEEGGE